MVKFGNPDVRQREKDRYENLLQALVGDNTDLDYNDAEYHTEIETLLRLTLGWADFAARIGQQRLGGNQKQ